MKSSVFLLGCMLAAVPVFAQNTSNPISGGTKMIYSMGKANILKSAEEMPEDGYSFKPTASVRSFGQIVAHVADGQYEFCGPLNADGVKDPEVEKTKTSKADIIAALKESFTYCDKAYDKLTDASAAEVVPFFGRKLAKVDVLQFNNVHNSEHYGNLVTYLRMKDLVPPSSQHQGQ